MAATMVPKKAPFNRDAVLERLFSLPLPPPSPIGKAYPIHTPLGRLMRLRGIRVQELAAMEGCPNYRVLSDYLAERREITPKYRGALGRALKVDARVL